MSPYLAIYIPICSNGVCNAQASSHSARILIGTIAAGTLLVIAIAIAGTCMFCVYRRKRSTLYKYDDKRQLTSKSKYTENLNVFWDGEFYFMKLQQRCFKVQMRSMQ